MGAKLTCKEKKKENTNFNSIVICGVRQGRMKLFEVIMIVKIKNI